jgi:hypothetical protein
LRFFLLFPDDRSPGRWNQLWPWLLSVNGLFFAMFWMGPYTVWEALWSGTAVLGMAAFLAVATAKFPGADRVARRQFKWVMLGTYAALVPLVVVVPLSARPGLGWLFVPSMAAGGFLPLSILISVARFNLFDVDRLVSGTVSYTVLMILLAFVGEVLFEPLAGWASSLLGVDPGMGQVAFVVTLAAVLVPTQRTMRPHVDRIFFSEGRALEEEAEDLLQEIARSDGARSVLDLAGGGVARLFEPRTCTVYQRSEVAFEPRLVAGSTLGEPLPAHSEVIHALENCIRPVLLDTRGATPRDRLRAGVARSRCCSRRTPARGWRAGRFPLPRHQAVGGRLHLDGSVAARNDPARGVDPAIRLAIGGVGSRGGWRGLGRFAPRAEPDRAGSRHPCRSVPDKRADRYPMPTRASRCFPADLSYPPLCQ